MGSTAQRLPVLVIGGYLGAGKTTLVNHLLRHSLGRRVAVLVNDFGSINIDAELISATTNGSEAGVISLAGGCLCCSFGDDLVGTLQDLARRQPPVDVVLLELSGVALPGNVARTARLAVGVHVVGCLVVVDATDIKRQALDVYVGETVSQQLQQADSLLLNKAGLLFEQAHASGAGQTLRETELWLGQTAPQAHGLTLEAHEVPAQWFWDWCEQGPQVSREWPARAYPLPSSGLTNDLRNVFRDDDLPDDRPGDPQNDPQNDLENKLQNGLARLAQRPLRRRAGAADETFVSFSLPLPTGLDLHRLGLLLSHPDLGVLRAKGLAPQHRGGRALLQLTNKHWQVTPVSAGGTSGLVVIGLRSALQERDLQRWVQSCVDTEPAIKT